jgi:U3 small nucleolar RNA-associated protein 25
MIRNAKKKKKIQHTVQTFVFLFVRVLFDSIFIFSVLNLTFLFLFFFCCRRYQIRGAKHIIFYSLPEYALFYAEYVNMLTRDASAAAAGEDEGDEGAAGRYNNTSGSGSGGSGDLGMESVSCLVLFTPYERMALERIVGPKRCAHMLNASQSTFMFC